MEISKRNRFIASSIQAGMTYTEIGQWLGFTKERVRQIAKKRGLKPAVPDGYVSAIEAANLLGYSRIHIYELCYCNKLPSIKRGKQRFVWPELRRGQCPCGKPIAKGRRRYCSQGCLEVAQAQSHKRSSWQRVRSRSKVRVVTSSL